METPKHSRESVPDLAAGLVEDAQRLVKLEIELAKQEMKELAISNGIAGGLLAGAGLLAMIALLVGIPVFLVAVLPWHWEVALIWVVLYVAAAVAMALIGKSMLRVQPPRRTLESLKETKEWALQQVRSSSR